MRAPAKYLYASLALASFSLAATDFQENQIALSCLIYDDFTFYDLRSLQSPT